MKRIKVLSILLTAAMLLAVLPIGVLAAEEDKYSGECGDNVTWHYDPDTKVLTISGTGPMTNYYRGLLIQKAPWADWSSWTGDIGMETVVIEQGVTTVGGYAFYECGSIKKVVLPSSITDIEDSAFDSCGSLTDITIPNSITSIGHRAFRFCTGLTSIHIPASVTYIETPVYDIFLGAFHGCYSLQQVTVDPNNPSYHSDQNCLIETATNTLLFGCDNSTIPSYVTKLCSYAFWDLSTTSITIPASVTEIETLAIGSCDNLTELNVEAGNPVYYGKGNCVIEKESGKLLLGCSNSVIPEGVTEIGESAFRYCYSLRDITIPDGVIAIDDEAFYKCGSSSISLPNSLVSIGFKAFSECGNLKNVTIPNSVTSIDGYAFSKCSQISSVYIPESVSNMGSYVFEYCYDLGSITCEAESQPVDWSMNWRSGCEAEVYWNSRTNSEYMYSIDENEVAILKYIGDYSDVTIPAEIDGYPVTSIREKAFECGYSIKSITIPSSVTDIQNRAFYSCIHSTDISIDENNTAYYVENNCIIDKRDQTLILGWGICSIPEDVMHIGEYAFYSCDSLTKVIIPDRVVSISSYAFYDCDNIRYVMIPDSVETIEEDAFYNCYDISAFFCESESKPDGWDSYWQNRYSATVHWGWDSNAVSALMALQPVDYLCFSELVYKDMVIGKTVKQLLGDQWDEKYGDHDYTYGELYEQVQNWVVLDYEQNYSSGFYACAFENLQGEVVIAYRGSTNPFDLFKGDPETQQDIFLDWIIYDLPMEVIGVLFQSGQIQDAMDFYDRIAADYPQEDINITGHSLGGLLGDIVSAYSGSEGITFNAVTALDVAYYYYPDEMSVNFAGVDKWNFVDHVNEWDALAGKYLLETLDDIGDGRIKRYVQHASGKHILQIFTNHGLASLLDPKQPTMMPAYYMFTPDTVLTRYNNLWCKTTLGTSGGDNIRKSFTIFAQTIYGGDGDDYIYAGPLNDVIIPGKGQNVADGGSGDDTYLYTKGSEPLIIQDIGGDDVLKLIGYSEADVISYYSINGGVVITCNGKDIAHINDTRAKGSSFEVIAGNYRYYIYGFKDMSLFGFFNIACPVDVNILDPQGNVVATLQDGIPTALNTEFGSFYVSENENGEFIKTVYLQEGYTIEIVGNDTGTMDITSSTFSEGVFGEAFELTDVPVSADTTAIIQGEGVPTLQIDRNSDGTFESSKPLYATNSLPGDVNGDGAVDALDYMLVKRHVLGSHEMTEEQIARADLDGNGVIEGLDYMTVKRAVLGTWPVVENDPEAE